MSDEDYVDKHLKRLVEKGPYTLASLRAEVERLTGERDRQYDQNAEQIIRIAALEAENEKLRAALSKISEYEIEEGCPCNACQHSAIARAALEGPQDRMAKPLEDEQ